MPMTAPTIPASKTALWSGRILSALVVLFTLFDGVAKVMKEPHAVQASAQLGYADRLIPVIGIILLICTVIYVIPRTSILGAVLLTGYLGGATASQMRIGSPLFETVFPIIFGVLVWLGLFLREERLRALIPLRREKSMP
ncbi:MAG TPA: DoxX family protein [Terriglobia bacterium]|nr:DoxX family protein [Terriglobia bacterium]